MYKLWPKKNSTRIHKSEYWKRKDIARGRGGCSRELCDNGTLAWPLIPPVRPSRREKIGLTLHNFYSITWAIYCVCLRCVRNTCQQSNWTNISIHLNEAQKVITEEIDDHSFIIWLFISLMSSAIRTSRYRHPINMIFGIDDKDIKVYKIDESDYQLKLWWVPLTSCEGHMRESLFPF